MFLVVSHMVLDVTKPVFGAQQSKTQTSLLSCIELLEN